MPAQPSALVPPAAIELEGPIAAVATPAGKGARAILRISGMHLDRWLPFLPTPLSRGCVPCELLVRELSAPVPIHAICWPSPHSFTGQDVVELHLLPASPLVTAVLCELERRGIRQARPGEFSLRAFLSGKLSLPQAEAIQHLVEAPDPVAARQAWDQLMGSATPRLHGLREDLLVVLAELEASLDFSEEDLSFLGKEQLLERLRNAQTELEECLRAVRLGRTARLPRVALVGPPNAGKSSLFNALSAGGRALVSPEAGTTRDVLLAEVDLGTLTIELADCAGWESEPAGEIATLAQRHAEQVIATADLVLECRPCTEETGPVRLASPKRWLVWTKADLAEKESCSPSAEDMVTSAITQRGIANLRERLEQHFSGSSNWNAGRSSGQVLNLLRQAVAGVEAAREQLAAGQPAELACLELRSSLDALGQLVGVVYSEDLLDRVFSRFCIGK